MRVEAEEHRTSGGRLQEGARGPVARQIIWRGMGGDFRGRGQICSWSTGVAADLLTEEVTI